MRIGIGRVQNETSHIHKLPCGLLQQVFHHACWSDKHKAPHSAVALSHVCYQWRVILLRTLQFWCGVTVDGGDPSFAATCLTRSGNLPLDVTMQFNCGATPDGNNVNTKPNLSILETEDVRWRVGERREGLTLLVAERDRIHRLYVNCILLGSDLTQDPVPEHGFFGYPLKNLRELWWCYDGEWESRPLPYQLFCGSFESLRHLRLENVAMSMGWIRNLRSLERVSGGDGKYLAFMPGRMPELFSRNRSLQSLRISGFRICNAYSPRICMDNLTSLSLDRIPDCELLFDLLKVKNFDGGTFTTISFSGRVEWIKFTAVNSIGFSLTTSTSSSENSEGDDFIRRYFSGVTSVRVEDYQAIPDAERLFSILRILGASEGGVGRLELRAEAEFDTDTEVGDFIEPFLPRLRALVIHLPEWVAPLEWVEMMVGDVSTPVYRRWLPDECMVEVYHSDSGFFLSDTMGEFTQGRFWRVWR